MLSGFYARHCTEASSIDSIYVMQQRFRVNPRLGIKELMLHVEEQVDDTIYYNLPAIYYTGEKHKIKKNDFIEDVINTKKI